MRLAPGGVHALSVLVASGALSSCKCGEDRPYTPFRIDSNVQGSASALASAALPSASASARGAALAPSDVSTWSVDSVPITVAPDRVIDRAVAADFDGDGTKDAVAWTRARGQPADLHTSGELVFFGGKTPAGRVVATMPGFVPAGPGCHQSVSLALTGPRTVTLQIGAHCDAQLLPRSPTGSVLVIAPASERPTVVGLRVADPAVGESFSIAVDSTDRDGDGRDDVRVTASLKTASDDQEAAADLVWLDRAAGPSRDESEPKNSFQALAAAEMTRARSKSTSKDALGRIANARRLYATLCAEGATARIFDAEGEPIPCSGMNAVDEALLGVEVRAALAQRDVLAAAAALRRSDFYGAPSPKALTALGKEILGVAPRRKTSLHALDVTPRAKAGLPRYSPLAFAADGTLLVETADGVLRGPLPDGPFATTGGDVPAWPLTVGGVAEPRWTGVAFPCDRSEVMLVESDPTGTPIPSEATALIAPRPGPCRPSGAPPVAEIAPLEWTHERRAGLIDGALFGAKSLSELSKAPAPGSPRSPDGKSIVFPSSLGVLVATSGKGEVWLSPEGTALSDCAVANGGESVACVRGDQAILLIPAPKKP